MADISHILSPAQRDMERVDATIATCLKSDLGVITDIANYITEGGKRVRPALTLMSTLACSYEGNDHIKFATAIEFIHTATLLHDDVVDNAVSRRGKEAAQAVWGNNMSVLTGDFLYSRAFQMLCEIGNLELVGSMSTATNVIAEGEVQQLANIGSDTISESECLRVAEKKTAKLFEAACGGAAILADADTALRDNMASFGLNFGLAFQLMDDVLDYAEGSGKRIGQDLSEGKPTLPFIHALRHCEDKDRQFFINALGSDKVKEVAALINAIGSFDYVREKARTYASVAAQKIAYLPLSPYRRSLEDLLQLAIERDY